MDTQTETQVVPAAPKKYQREYRVQCFLPLTAREYKAMKRLCEEERLPFSRWLCRMALAELRRVKGK